MSQPTPLAAAQQNARILRTNGDPAGAKLMLHRALEAARGSYGEDHPDVIGTAHLLAGMHVEDGEPAAARRVLEEAVAAGQRRYADAEPLMLALYAMLGGVAEELGNRHEARRNFTRVLANGPAALGEEHQWVRAARAYLGAGEPAQGAPPPAPPPEVGYPEQPRVGPPFAAGQEFPTRPAQPDHPAQPAQPLSGRPDAGARPRWQAGPQPEDRGETDSAGPAPQRHLAPTDHPGVWAATGEADGAAGPEPRISEEPWQGSGQGRSGATAYRTGRGDGGGQGHGRGDLGHEGGRERPAWTGYGDGGDHSAAWRSASSTPDSSPADPLAGGGGDRFAATGDRFSATRSRFSATGDRFAADDDPFAAPVRPGASTAPAPRRSRGPLVAASIASVAALAAVAASIVAVTALNRDRSTPDPAAGGPQSVEATVASSGAPPTRVKLKDDGTAVTVTWTDPTDGTVPFIVAKGLAGEQPHANKALPAGQTRFTLQGLNPELEYCFMVVAVYSSDVLVPSDQVCTHRSSATPDTGGDGDTSASGSAEPDGEPTVGDGTSPASAPAIGRRGASDRWFALVGGIVIAPGTAAPGARCRLA